MLTDLTQRWRGGRSSYRPVGEPIDTRVHDVARIEGDAQAKTFVEAHHYSRSYPAARERFGLYRSGNLVGVAVFSVPMSGAVLDLLPCPRSEAVELGRLVLLDEVEANGESWFVGRCFDLLRADGYAGVVSFSDPQSRHDRDGNLVKPGHVGIVYQATNGIYTGRATPRTLRILPDGSIFSDRAASKIRTREKGWAYSMRQLLDHGARAPAQGEDLTAWLADVLTQVTRRARHPGNHRYAWMLDRAGKRALVPHLRARGIEPLGYPKVLA